MLEQAIANDADIAQDRVLTERLAKRASETRKRQHATGREKALKAAEDDDVRTQAREATHYKWPSPKTHRSQRRSKRDDETPGEL